jgi:uncharacterized peroxidase-related enzyme
MARLKQISPNQASGEVKNIYTAIEKKMGSVPNIFQYMADSLPLLKGFISLTELCNSTHLSPKLREEIVLAVSQNNNCQYCLSAHSAVAKNLGLKEKEILDSRKASSGDPKTKAILEFTKKFIEKKGMVNDQEVNQLKTAGLNEGEIGDVLLVILSGIYSNYFNHLNNTPIDFPEAVRLEEVAAVR